MNSFEPHGLDTELEQGNGREAGALFAGDTGELAFDTRRVLVLLLTGPSLDGRRHSKLWPVLVRDEALVRARLSELFLDLVVDHEQQVAFTRQADVAELEAPVLLRRLKLTFIDSVLLLFLRGRLTQADAHDERATVDALEMTEHLALYRRAVSTDDAGFAKAAVASIEKMKKGSILQKIRGSEDRYEISPTLKLLFPAEEVQALTRQYLTLIQEAGGAASTAIDSQDKAE